MIRVRVRNDVFLSDSVKGDYWNNTINVNVDGGYFKVFCETKEKMNKLLDNVCAKGYININDEAVAYTYFCGKY